MKRQYIKNQVINVAEIEMIVENTKENLQDVIDAILCSANILGYGVKYSRKKRGITILIFSNNYCFHVHFYYYEEFGKNILHQIYVTDTVDDYWNGEFRHKRYKSFGEINSINGVGFFKPLDNFLKALSCFNPNTGNFNKIG